MPHYVVHDDEDNPGTFFMYSTTVDNAISKPMSPEQMHQHLLTHDYGTWVDRERGDALRQPRFYWETIHQCEYPGCEHSHGFWYVKQSENYYTLPKEHWRND